MKTEYRVVIGHGSDATDARQELMSAVNDHIVEGWVCQGGVSFSMCVGPSDDYREEYAQAMIKTEEIK